MSYWIENLKEPADRIASSLAWLEQFQIAHRWTPAEGRELLRLRWLLSDLSVPSVPPNRPATAEEVRAEVAPAEPLTDGVRLIATERERQVAQEDWTPQHDDAHTDGELVRAAVCYLAASYNGDMPNWPWDYSWWKPSDDPIRNLVKAGALIAAEIDRLHRENKG